ncbi:MAG: M20/M25/M40 family metallo-hydrolase [Chloroflexota bacterium]
MTVANLKSQFESHFTDNLADYLGLLKQMVDINSFTANTEGVNELAQVTADIFTPLGFEAELIQSTHPNVGKHVVLTKQGRGKHKIGLVSHLDTVFPPEEEIRNSFSWREDGDKIYGPGTVDIKGGTVMIYMILDVLKTHQPELYDETTWVILINAAEETGGADFGPLCIERLQGDNTLGCLIFEGGSRHNDAFKVVVTRKGMATYTVTVDGRAAHAGTSHPDGANAIVQLGHTVQAIGEMTDYDRQLTYNVGTISGGTVTNRVPHQAQARIEMRTFETDIFEDGIKQMLALNGQSQVSSPNDGFPCKVTVEVTRQTQPWSRNERTDRLFNIWKEAGAEIGYTVVPEFRGGLSDGNHFWHALPTTDGLGPSGRNAHCSEQSEDGTKEQEYVSVSSFVPKAILNTFAIMKLIEKGTA